MNLALVRSLLVILLAFCTSGPLGTQFVENSSAGRHEHRNIIIRERHGTQVTSSNWSGYAVTGATGSVTDATGSWIVPTVDCTSTPTAYSATWVGIDGYSSNTVEQIGTESDCINGEPTNYAWFEFYPHLSYTIESAAIKPNDLVSAEVKYSRGEFVVSISINNGAPFTTSTKLKQADRSSADWIVEAPYSGGVLPLADFKTVSFGMDHTGVKDTNDAVIENASGPIGSFSSSSVFSITMTADNGGTKAQPSALSADKSSFMEAWYDAGP